MLNLYKIYIILVISIFINTLPSLAQPTLQPSSTLEIAELDDIKGVALSANEKRIVTFGTHAIVWDLETKQKIMTVSDPGSTIRSAAFSPDGKKLATGAENASVKIWDIASGELLQSFRTYTYTYPPVGGPYHVSAVAFSPDGTTLAATDYYGYIRLWDLTQNQEMLTLTVAGGSNDRLFFLPGGLSIFLSQSNQGVLISLPEKRILHEIEGGATHPIIDESLALNMIGDYTSSDDHEIAIRTWDLATGHLLNQTPFLFVGRSVQKAVFSPDGTTVVIKKSDMQAEIWDTHLKTKFANFGDSAMNIESFAFLSSRADLFGVSGNKIHFYDISNIKAAVQGSGIHEK